MLELSLKFYIAAAYKHIRDVLDGQLPFKYGYKDIENFPLERLLGIFAKLSDEQVLLGRLNKLVPKRNLVAHRALVYRHEVITDLLEINTSALLEDLKAVEAELEECQSMLGKIVARMLKLDDDGNSSSSNPSRERTAFDGR
jgi:hypothetical protein